MQVNTLRFSNRPARSAKSKIFIFYLLCRSITHRHLDQLPARNKVAMNQTKDSLVRTVALDDWSPVGLDILKYMASPRSYARIAP